MPIWTMRLYFRAVSAAAPSQQLWLCGFRNRRPCRPGSTRSSPGRANAEAGQRSRRRPTCRRASCGSRPRRRASSRPGRGDALGPGVDRAVHVAEVGEMAILAAGEKPLATMLPRPPQPTIARMTLSLAAPPAQNVDWRGSSIPRQPGPTAVPAPENRADCSCSRAIPPAKKASQLGAAASAARPIDPGAPPTAGDLL